MISSLWKWQTHLNNQFRTTFLFVVRMLLWYLKRFKEIQPVNIKLSTIISSLRAHGGCRETGNSEDVWSLWSPGIVPDTDNPLPFTAQASYLGSQAFLFPSLWVLHLSMPLLSVLRLLNLSQNFTIKSNIQLHTKKDLFWRQGQSFESVENSKARDVQFDWFCLTY